MVCFRGDPPCGCLRESNAGFRELPWEMSDEGMVAEDETYRVQPIQIYRIPDKSKVRVFSSAFPN